MKNGRCTLLVIIAEERVAKYQRIINNLLPMKKLLLTFALAGVVSAGAASSACAYCALAYNPNAYPNAPWANPTGWAYNCSTLEEAKAMALAQCPGGRIEFASATRGFYDVSRWRDHKGHFSIAWGQGATTHYEAYRQATTWCSQHGVQAYQASADWQETVGSSGQRGRSAVGNDREDPRYAPLAKSSRNRARYGGTKAHSSSETSLG